MDRGAWWATVYEVTEESDMTWQLNNNSYYKILANLVGIYVISTLSFSALCYCFFSVICFIYPSDTTQVSSVHSICVLEYTNISS